jgi:hypothetical protein
MPRVRKVSDRGVRVAGIVRQFTGEPASGRKVVIELPGIYAWRGRILIRKQSTTTDRDGRFEFWLPPTSELRPVDGGEEAPEYWIACDGVGSWTFQVPDGITAMDID